MLWGPRDAQGRQAWHRSSLLCPHSPAVHGSSSKSLAMPRLFFTPEVSALEIQVSDQKRAQNNPQIAWQTSQTNKQTKKYRVLCYSLLPQALYAGSGVHPGRACNSWVRHEDRTQERGYLWRQSKTDLQRLFLKYLPPLSTEAVILTFPTTQGELPEVFARAGSARSSSPWHQLCPANTSAACERQTTCFSPHPWTAAPISASERSPKTGREVIVQGGDQPSREICLICSDLQRDLLIGTEESSTLQEWMWCVGLCVHVQIQVWVWKGTFLSLLKDCKYFPAVQNSPELISGKTATLH